MLLGLDLVQTLVQSVILTGRVKHESPVSLLLIATPECGKTSVVCDRPCKAIAILTDVTGGGLLNLCRMQPETTHFVLNDMTAPMGHKASVSNYTLSMINAMTEEGIQAIAIPGGIQTFDNEHGKRGLIGCLTPGMAKDGRSWWNKHGLSTRMLPFFYDHGKDLALKIKASIDASAYSSRNGNPAELKVPVAPIDVAIPEPMRPYIRKMADRKARELDDPKGYRRLRQYRALCKAHALLRSWKQPQVGELDIQFLRDIDPFVSYDEPHPL